MQTQHPPPACQLPMIWTLIDGKEMGHTISMSER